MGVESQPRINAIKAICRRPEHCMTATGTLVAWNGILAFKGGKFSY